MSPAGPRGPAAPDRPRTPPPTFVELRRWPVAGLASLRESRHRARLAAASLVTRQGRVDAASARLVETVVTELVANAVQHGAPPTSARVLSDGHRILVEVVDHAPDRPPVQPRELGEDPPPRLGGGRGVAIVRTLSVDSGWYVDGGAKHVWALLSV